MSSIQLIAGARATGGAVGPLLTAIEALSVNGIVARTGASSAAARTITGTAGQIVVTDGDGAAGNPTLTLGSDAVLIAAVQTLTNKTLTAPTINTATISGGTIDNAPIGGTTRAAIAGTTGAFNADLTLSGAPGRIKPAANSTTALQLTNAAGTSVVNVDTTNSRVGIGVTNPTLPLVVNGLIRSLDGSDHITLDSVASDPTIKLFRNGSYETNIVGTTGGIAVLGGGSGTTLAAGFSSSSTTLPGTSIRVGLVSDTTPTAIDAQMYGTASGKAITIKTFDAPGNPTERFGINGRQNIASVYFTNSNVGIGTTSPSALLHAVIDDSTTDTVIIPLRLDRTSNGTPAAGIGTGIDLQTEYSAGNTGSIAQIHARTTALSQTGDLIFLTANGGAPAEKMRLTSAGLLNLIGTAQVDGLRIDVTPTAETITPTHTITISVNGTNYKIPIVAA